MGQTELIFSTPAGGKIVQNGSTIVTDGLASRGINTKPFSPIRIFLSNRGSSETDVQFLLRININGELVAFLDVVELAPGEAFTQVYEVAGTRLTIQTLVEGAATGNIVDVFVYGRCE